MSQGHFTLSSVATMTILRRFAPYFALLLLTLILTYPTIFTLTTHVVDRQDPLLNTWIMGWEAHAVRTGNSFFTTNIFYPLTNSLAFSEILLSTSLIVMPITWLTGNAVLSYNLAFLFAFFSTAVGVYILAYYLTGHRGAAPVAAVAFAWSPYRMGHLSQLQLLTFGWLPIALMYLDRLLRHKGDPTKNAVLFGLFFALQALASFYAAIFSAGACAVYVVGWLLWKRKMPIAAPFGIVLAALITAMLVVPVALPYFQVQKTLGAGWTLEDNEQFSASLQAYAYAPEGTLFWDAITRPLAYSYGACCPPDSLFPGVTLVALGVFALWQARGGRRWLWLLLAVVAFVLSLGPSLTIYANQPTAITLPYKWLYENVFGFNAIRAPVRWAVLVTLALSLLAAVGVARLKWRWAWVMALGLVIAEFAVFPLRVVPLPVAPPSLAWLAEQPPTRILELPLAADQPTSEVDGPDWQKPRLLWEQSRLLEMQYFSTFHWHTTLDGYSGYVPARHGDFARELESFPSERSVLLLQKLGVQYVVLHEAGVSEEKAAWWSRPLPTSIENEQRIGSDRILELTSHSDLPLAEVPVSSEPLTLTFPISQVPPNATMEVPLIIESRYMHAIADTSPDNLYVTWTNQAGGVITETVPFTYPPIVDKLTVLSIPVHTPSAGEWLLSLRATFPNDSIKFDPELEYVVFEVTTIKNQSITVTPDANPQNISPDYLPVIAQGVMPVDTGRLTLTWRSYQILPHDYSISVRLVDDVGNVVAQKDGPPGGDTSTSAWLAGEPYSATFELAVPDDVDPSDLRLMVVWYDANRNVAARVWDGEQFIDQLYISIENK